MKRSHSISCALLRPTRRCTVSASGCRRRLRLVDKLVARPSRCGLRPLWNSICSTVQAGRFPLVVPCRTSVFPFRLLCDARSNSQAFRGEPVRRALSALTSAPVSPPANCRRLEKIPRWSTRLKLAARPSDSSCQLSLLSSSSLPLHLSRSGLFS